MKICKELDLPRSLLYSVHKNQENYLTVHGMVILYIVILIISPFSRVSANMVTYGRTGVCCAGYVRCHYTGWPNKNGTAYFSHCQYVDEIAGISV